MIQLCLYLHFASNSRTYHFIVTKHKANKNGSIWRSSQCKSPTRHYSETPKPINQTSTIQKYLLFTFRRSSFVCSMEVFDEICFSSAYAVTVGKHFRFSKSCPHIFFSFTKANTNVCREWETQRRRAFGSRQKALKHFSSNEYKWRSLSCATKLLRLARKKKRNFPSIVVGDVKLHWCQP